MILSVITVPNPLLEQKCRSLTKDEILSNKIQKLIQQMKPTMYLKDGAGLAAPQIGESLRICVISRDYNIDAKEDIVLINPEWQKASLTQDWGEEGCLSVPNVFGKVKRYKKIKVSALDEKGEKTEFKSTGVLARIIQHEVDHLDGVLFTSKAKNLHNIYRE